MVRGNQILLASALLALVPATAAAQNASAADNSIEMNTATDTTMPNVSEPMAADPMAADPMVDNTTMLPVEEEDDDFPWGILGLLGLAGLLGLKRRDNDHVRVEPRSDNRL